MLQSTSSANLPGQNQTERHAVGAPSLTSANAAFVLGPKTPVHRGMGGGREEATENKSCSVFLNCGSKDHLHLQHSP